MLAAAAFPRLSLCRSRRHVTPTRQRGRGEEAGPRGGTPPHVTGSLHGGPAPASREPHAPEFPTPVTARAAGAVGAARGPLAGTPRPQLNHRRGCRTEGPGRASLWTAAGSQAVGRKWRRANMLGQTAEQINSGWPGIRPRGPSGASRSIRGNLGGEWVRGPEKTVSESSGSGVAGLLRSLGQASST